MDNEDKGFGSNEPAKTVAGVIERCIKRNIYIDGNLADCCSQALHEVYGYKDGELHLATESDEGFLSTGLWSVTSTQAKPLDCYVYAAGSHVGSADLMRFTDHLHRCEDPQVVTVLVLPERAARSFYGDLMVEYAESFGVHCTEDWEGCDFAIRSAATKDV